jgi:hypothetical protein
MQSQSGGAHAPSDVHRRPSSPYARVPEWLLYAQVSDRAIRLFAILARHARSDGTGADPGRTRLARLLGCSLSTLDRARRELEAVGAIEVDRSRVTTWGDQDTNLYRLRSDRPTGLVLSDETLQQRIDPVVARDEGRLVAGDEQTRAISNESQMNETAPYSPPRAVDEEERDIDLLLEAFYDEAGYPEAETRSEFRLHRRAMREIRDVGGTPDDVRAAVEAWLTKYDRDTLNPKVLTKWWGSLMRTASDGAHLIDW